MLKSLMSCDIINLKMNACNSAQVKFDVYKRRK